MTARREDAVPGGSSEAGADLEIVEYTDPACPWAWGSEPTFRRLRRATGPQVRWRRVFGMLFDDADPPAPDRVAETRHYERWLAGVSEHTGAPFPFVLHWVAASSRPASLVARAAADQGDVVGERALRRLRETTFVAGRPADTLAAALDAVRGVPGLDHARVRADAISSRVAAAIDAERAEARRPDPMVDRVADTVADDGPHPGHRKQLDDGERYALPTLLLTGPAGRVFVPGWQPWQAYADAVAAVAPGVRLADVRVDPDELLHETRGVTAVELDLLAGGCRPSRATRFATRNGGVWRPI